MLHDTPSKEMDFFSSETAKKISGVYATRITVLRNRIARQVYLRSLVGEWSTNRLFKYKKRVTQCFHGNWISLCDKTIHNFHTTCSFFFGRPLTAACTPWFLMIYIDNKRYAIIIFLLSMQVIPFNSLLINSRYKTFKQ